MDTLPKTRHHWLKLIALPFKAYSLCAYWFLLLYARLAPRGYVDGDEVVCVILGYLASFWALVCVGVIQRCSGARDDAQSTWLVALLAPLFIWLLLPGLAG
jgi:hypothetical protein